MESIREQIEILNQTDECRTLEAKRGSAIDRSVLETVCAFANEPGMGGGTILLGVERDDASLFPTYVVTGVADPDKIQLDLASQCAARFNQPVRPQIITETIGDRNVVSVTVDELPDGQKPLYFKNESLPRGAYRRIGSSDQRCTDDDLFVFYKKEDSLDSSLIPHAGFEDVSPEAVELYRKLRARVNEFAEELSYDDEDLLYSLGCMQKPEGEWKLTYTGLLVFGKRLALRRILPMARVDYIRVPGNEWVKDPESRFTTVDMRGPSLELVQRVFNAIADDLPKGFLLPEGQIQAESIGLPARVLREALVNAFIHRSYRENEPIQIIRYGNRLEIRNPGFSLKPEEELGEPGSRNRNPFIAAIFHDTNLAETKGSGIRTMRRLMEKSGMAPPTFESDHANNRFTIRLLLHHFLNESDLEWLDGFSGHDLSDNQKRALIFLREAGALDNSSYRQLNGLDTLKASSELRQLRDFELIQQKGQGRATYYIPGNSFGDRTQPQSDGDDRGTDSLSSLVNQSGEGTGKISGLSYQLKEPDSSDKPNVHAHLEGGGKVIPLTDLSEKKSSKISALANQLPPRLLDKLEAIGKRSADKQATREAILQLCDWKPLSLKELAELLHRHEKYLLYRFIGPLRKEGYLSYTIPEMPNHPAQAYKTLKGKNDAP